ncbi:MAG: hypothetical protein NTW29_12505 [Bacteroidetes bacterium]|nr:hypothetical protein [Bacteroidota bacterium]
MKKFILSVYLLAATAVLFSSCSSSNAITQSPAAPASIDYQDFYDGLSPYGTWIDYPAYGHVWHPGVAGDFRPYLTNGYWDYTNEGWMWQSNYNWGWAPFHYGRWTYDNTYGWLWIPGYEWSPAWVTWGNVDNYYAWAPLLPEVNAGFAFNQWRPAPFYWNFCGREHIYDRDIYDRVERREFAVNYATRINIINNFDVTRIHYQYYCKGPEVSDVQKYANRTIEPVSIRETNKASLARRAGNEVHVYRPPVLTAQPREFRRIDNPTATPAHNSDAKIRNEGTDQKQNVERLPVHKAPESAIRRERPMNNSKKNRR